MLPIARGGLVWSVGLSVCLFVTTVNPAKAAEPIVMLFGMWLHVSPWNHMLDNGPDPQTRRGNFEGEDGLPLYIPSGRYSQSDSAEGDTDTVRMPIGVGK